MPKEYTYDVIVVGFCGLYGSSALYHAAKISRSMPPKDSVLFSRPRVLGIDQYTPGHTQGSSHGESRITRVATGEGSEYVQLAKRSHELWHTIEKETAGRYGQLCHLTGGLIIASEEEKGNYHGSKEGFLQQTRACATAFNIPHQNLSAKEMRQRFPQFQVEDHESGYLEKETMGYIRPDACINAQLALAIKNGAELHTGEKLVDFHSTKDGVEITTLNAKGEKSHYKARKLILTTGPWTPQLLQAKQPTKLKVYRQTLYWFKIAEKARADYAVGQFPPFIWDGGAQKGIVYGFPILEGNCIKIGSEKFLEDTDPDRVDRNVSAAEVTEMYATFIKPNFVSVTSNCIKKASCLYTVAPGHRFVIDFLPDSDENVIVVSACSGHGAKHSAAVGEAVAQLSLTKQATIDVIDLFGGLRPAPSTLRAKL